MGAWSLWDGWQAPLCCGARQGPAAVCEVAQCSWGCTGPALNRWCLRGPGLQIFCWMIRIILTFQVSQAQRGCLHTRQVAWDKNTHLSLPKLLQADSGGHGLWNRFPLGFQGAP